MNTTSIPKVQGFFAGVSALRCRLLYEPSAMRHLWKVGEALVPIHTNWFLRSMNSIEYCSLISPLIIRYFLKLVYSMNLVYST